MREGGTGQREGRSSPGMRGGGTGGGTYCSIPIPLCQAWKPTKGFPISACKIASGLRLSLGEWNESPSLLRRLQQIIETADTESPAGSAHFGSTAPTGAWHHRIRLHAMCQGRHQAKPFLYALGFICKDTMSQWCEDGVWPLAC